MSAATAAAAAERLDLRVSREAGVSRAAAQVLIAAGHVTVNGRAGRAGQRVGGADGVLISPPPPRPPTATLTAVAPTIELAILHEDADLAVIDKPAGLVVHPAPGHPEGTLADALRARGSTWSQLGGPERPGIVHRLDRDTSGLLVVAKTERAHRSLAAQLAARTMGREYWALVHGGFAEAAGEIDAPVGRDPRHRQRMAVVDSGRPAITDFTVGERLRRHTQLLLQLRSGRTHQIRVHLAYIRHPIVGDSLYSRSEDGELSSRPALHAARLHFVHPADGRPCEYSAPLPPDLVAVLESARAL